MFNFLYTLSWLALILLVVLILKSTNTYLLLKWLLNSSIILLCILKLKPIVIFH